MSAADVDLAIAYINEITRRPKLVSPKQVTSNRLGVITFKLEKHSFRIKDALDALLILLTKSFECKPHRKFVLSYVTGYVWDVGPERTVCIELRKDYGTFIQLIEG